MKKKRRRRTFAHKVLAFLLVIFTAIAFFKLATMVMEEENSKKTHTKQQEETLEILCPKLSESGDAFLLKHDNEAVLIDTGVIADGNTILQMMKDHGIESLKALILTHFDKDHIGGAAQIINSVPVEKCYMTCGSKDSEEYAALMEALYHSETDQYTVTDLNSFNEIGAYFTINPPRTYNFEDDEDNNRSLIVSVDYQDRHLLFPGDSKGERLDQYFDHQYHETAYDFMIVPHHGRNHKQLERFLEKFTPTHAVITSSSEEPADEEIETDLVAAGTKPWYTMNGDIVFHVTADGIDAFQGQEAYYHQSESPVEEVAEATTQSADITTEVVAQQMETAEVAQPGFSQESGFYDEAFQLTMDVPEGTTVYYNMSSAAPTTESTPYTGEILIEDNSSQPNVYCNLPGFWPYIRHPAIPGEPELINGYYARFEQTKTLIDKCVVVRAMAVDANGNASKVKTATYFIGYGQKSGYENTAVMSLVSEPYGLFSNEAGIMVNGETYNTKVENGEIGTNTDTHDLRIYTNAYTGRGREWEREVHIDYFEEGGQTHVFSQEAGIRLHGNQSRIAYPQKSFNLYARKSYDGNSTFLTSFFGDGILSNRVTLLAGKNTRGYYLSEIMNNRTMDTQHYKMVQVFLDGEYWGLYAIQERYSSDKYMKAHYDLNTEDYVMVAGKPYEFQLKNGVEKTTLTSFRVLKSYVKEHDMSDPKEYARVCSMMDMQSFIDVYASRIYTSDQDWSWMKNQYLAFYENQWHWFLFDTDYGAGAHDDALASENSFLSIRNVMDATLNNDPLFQYLVANEQFRIDFLNTLMDMMNDVYKPGKIYQDKENNLNQYMSAYQKNLERYPAIERENKDGSENFYVGDWNKIETFFRERPDYIMQYMKEYFQFPGHQVYVQFEVNDQEGGKLKINTITPELDENNIWTGQYFQECPVTVTAIPKEGWEFAGWEAIDTTVDYPEQASTTIGVGPGSALKAIFVRK